MKISIALTADDIKSMMSRQYGFKETDMIIKNLDDHIIVECDGLPTSSICYIPNLYGIDNTPMPTITDDGMLNNIPMDFMDRLMKTSTLFNVSAMPDYDEMKNLK